MDDFLNKYGPWAVITGATSGTGYQFAQELAKKGFHLILVARGEEALNQTKKIIQDRYHVQVKIVATDLSTENAISEIEKVTQSLEVGLLINNAGYCITGEFHRDNWENQSRLLHTILETPMVLTHMFVQEMVKRGRGGIIFVSSSAAYTPMPLWSVYSAGKAALLSFGESISQELKKYNIDILTVCPGGMKTNFQNRAGVRSPGLMGPEKVVEMSLRSLGVKISLLPGIANKMIFQVMGKLLPNFIRLQLIESFIKKAQSNVRGESK